MVRGSPYTVEGEDIGVAVEMRQAGGAQGAGETFLKLDLPAEQIVTVTDGAGLERFTAEALSGGEAAAQFTLPPPPPPPILLHPTPPCPTNTPSQKERSGSMSNGLAVRLAVAGLIACSGFRWQQARRSFFWT